MLPSNNQKAYKKPIKSADNTEVIKTDRAQTFQWEKSIFFNEQGDEEYTVSEIDK